MNEAVYTQWREILLSDELTEQEKQDLSRQILMIIFDKGTQTAPASKTFTGFSSSKNGFKEDRNAVRSPGDGDRLTSESRILPIGE
jgi:hypothetical protein